MISRLRKMYIVFLLLTLVGAIGCVVLYKMIERNSVRTYKAKAAVEFEAVKGQQGATLRSALSEISSTTEILSRSIISRDGTVSFIEYIESLARVAGASITISSVNVVDSGMKNANVENLQLTLDTQGSWVNIHTFLKILESLPYKASIQSAVFDRGVFSELGKDKISKTSTALTIWKGTFIINVLKRK